MLASGGAALLLFEAEQWKALCSFLGNDVGSHYCLGSAMAAVCMLVRAHVGWEPLTVSERERGRMESLAHSERIRTDVQLITCGVGRSNDERSGVEGRRRAALHPRGCRLPLCRTRCRLSGVFSSTARSTTPPPCLCTCDGAGIGNCTNHNTSSLLSCVGCAMMSDVGFKTSKAPKLTGGEGVYHLTELT